MGGEFGALGVRIRRVAYYSLSPFEQKAWVRAISCGLPNLGKRFLSALPTVLPGFLMGAWTYHWTVTEHERLLRKNPKDFENDE